MNRLLVLLALAACAPAPAFAWDPLSVLNNALQGQVNRQINRGVSEVFGSIETPSTGTRPDNADIRDARPDEVVIYTTPTCGYCKQALAHLDSRRIPYLQKDVSGNSQAQSELRALGGRGVPLTLMGTQKLIGFSAASFDTAYARFQTELAQSAASPKTAAGPSASGFASGDVLVARIARVKLFAEAKPAARAVGQLARQEEVIFLGETQGRYLKVRGADAEGWADEALLAKPQ